jgi:hypothetical protein
MHKRRSELALRVSRGGTDMDREAHLRLLKTATSQDSKLPGNIYTQVNTTREHIKKIDIPRLPPPIYTQLRGRHCKPIICDIIWYDKKLNETASDPVDEPKRGVLKLPAVLDTVNKIERSATLDRSPPRIFSYNPLQQSQPRMISIANHILNPIKSLTTPCRHKSPEVCSGIERLRSVSSETHSGTQESRSPSPDDLNQFSPCDIVKPFRYTTYLRNLHIPGFYVGSKKTSTYILRHIETDILRYPDSIKII